MRTTCSRCPSRPARSCGSTSRNIDPKITSVCCGWTSRGVGIGDGKIFVGRLDGRLVALDQRTGREVWSIQAERWEEGFSMTSAPLYYDGMVITGFSGAEIGVRGRVKAYDADDGKLLWTFYTIPGPGELGHDTWPQDNEVWMHGGATVWQTPAVDPELGLIYFSTGNPGPDFNGAVRAGDNLFSASIVAIEARTGKYRWHFQEVHHDLWDYDAPNPVVLFDVRIGGTRAQGARASRQDGLGVHPRPRDRRAADRHRGAARAAGAAAGDGRDAAVPARRRDRAAARRHRARGLSARESGPHLHAVRRRQGHDREPEPLRRRELAAELVRSRCGNCSFVCASDVTGNFIGGDRDFEIPPDGQHYEGGVVGFAPLPRTGIFAAVDVTTNTLAWRYRWSDQCYSGSLATAGGLVFVGRNDGRLTALDSDTGLAALGVPDRRRHECADEHVRARRQAVRRRAVGRQRAGRRAAKGDSVWLFGLDGTLPPAAERDTESRTTAVPPPAPSDARRGARRSKARKFSRRRASRAMARTAEAGTAAARRSTRSRIPRLS